MNLPSAPDSLVTFVEAVTKLLAQAKSLLTAVRWLLQADTPRVSYENVLLDIVLDIQDRRGWRATLDRRQVVRFLVEESGVVRDLVWGDGRPLARYRVQGGRRLAVNREGSRLAILLGLPRRPAKHEQASLHSRRVVRGALLQSSEYCETLVERPTNYLAMKVIFPRTRPPRDAYLVTSAPSQAAQAMLVSYTAQGRAVVSWTCSRPMRDRVYSLRWSW